MKYPLTFMLGIFAAAKLVAAVPEARPNILFIFSDDHAQHAISAYGSKVNQTPNLDRLAREGMRFSQACVTNSICTPSRASVLTGLYSHANGVPVFNRFDGSKANVAKMLRTAGYHTGMIGKWHLGSMPTGFDRWIILPGQGVYSDPVFITPHGKLTIKGHVSPITTQLGIEWLETRPKDKPFFLMLHHKAPHRPWEPDAKNKALFKDRKIPEPATLWDDYATRPAALPENKQTVARDLNRVDLKIEPPTPLPPGPKRRQWNTTVPMELEVTQADGSKRVLTGQELVRWKYQRYMQDYLACVQGVDDSVGEVLEYLEKTGLAKNTIVIYSSDNGWYLGDLGLFDKRFMYEPGLHIPLIVRGPGIKQGVTDLFALNVDFAPTFLALAGVPVPSEMHGKSLVPLLHGEQPKEWRKSLYYRYYHDPGHHNTRAHYGVRTATHKLIYYWKKNAWELFDLVKDPTEQRNLAGDPAFAGILAELKAEIVRLQKEFGDTGQYADELPKDGVDAPVNVAGLGEKTVKGAIEASAP